MWAWIGVALAALGAALALRQLRARQPNPFAQEEYGMTARSHARFLWASSAFAAVFVAAAFVRAVPVVPLVAIYVLLLVIYAASFARGFTEG